MNRALGVKFVTGSVLVLALATWAIAILIPDWAVSSESPDQDSSGENTDAEDSQPQELAALQSTLWSEVPQSANVVPGGVYRWPGGDATLCGTNDQSWSPVDGSCWYPVDLLTDQKTLTIWQQDSSGRSELVLEILDYPYPVQHLTIQDDSKVNLSDQDAARANRESARIGQLWSLRSPRHFSLPLARPLATLPEGGRFGSRRFINGQPKNPHSGSDYAATTGTPILAVDAGTVVLAEDHFFAGNSVFIDHGDGLISMSFHMNRIQVSRGDIVEQGQAIGTVGATGRVTGPHLHFGLRWRSKRIDPEALFGRTAD